MTCVHTSGRGTVSGTSCGRRGLAFVAARPAPARPSWFGLAAKRGELSRPDLAERPFGADLCELVFSLQEAKEEGDRPLAAKSGYYYAHNTVSPDGPKTLVGATEIYKHKALDADQIKKLERENSGVLRVFTVNVPVLVAVTLLAS